MNSFRLFSIILQKTFSISMFLSFWSADSVPLFLQFFSRRILNKLVNKPVIHNRQDHSYLLLTLSFVQPLLLALVTNSVHPPPSCVISQNTLTVSAEFGFCKKMVYKPSVLLLQRSANSRHERIGTKKKRKKEKKELILLRFESTIMVKTKFQLINWENWIPLGSACRMRAKHFPLYTVAVRAL